MNRIVFPLISVIVPVYNSESCIVRCIESIQNQSYSNLEILLVNNWSTDNSKEVCRKYAEKDERIICLTKENGGPPVARNEGIDSASGEYLFFVDGEDYLAYDTIEKLYKRIATDYSVMALCGVNKVKKDNRILKTFIPSDGVITGLQALKMSCNEDNGILFCSMIENKLYHHSLFVNIRFTEGKDLEGEATVYKLLDQCAAVSLVSEALYYDLDHEDSTMKLPYSAQQLDGIEASYQRYFCYKKKGRQYEQLVISEGNVFVCRYFQSKIHFVPNSKKEKERVREIDRKAREICFDNFKRWTLTRKMKLLAPTLYIVLGHMKKKIMSDFQIIKAAIKYINADTIPIHNIDVNKGETYLILNHTNSGAGIMTELLACLGWLRYAKQNGFTLVVNMTTLFPCYNEVERTRWEDYYNQPMLGEPVTEELLKDIKLHNRYVLCEVGKTRSNLLYYGKVIEAISKVIPPKIVFPDVRDYKQNVLIHHEFCDLYKHYFFMNEDVRNYVERECADVLHDRGVVLGVIVRGSDYVQMKTKNTPSNQQSKKLLIRQKK